MLIIGQLIKLINGSQLFQSITIMYLKQQDTTFINKYNFYQQHTTFTNNIP